MTKLNFFSTTSLLLTGALVGLTLAACDLDPKMIGNETEETIECKEGEGKQTDDCNSCTCIDGNWACTEKVCEGQTVQCEDGESKLGDDLCNTCICMDGLWSCTELDCGDATSTTGGSDTDPGTSTGGTSATGGTVDTVGTTGGTVGTSTSTTGDDTGGVSTVGTSTSTTGDTDDTGGPSTSTSTTGDYEPQPAVPCDGEAVPLADIPTIFAYTQSQVPPKPDTTGMSTGGGGGELEPGTLHVSLSNRPLVCADPEAQLQCGGEWEVSIVIPPEFQSPGLYNLSGQDVRGFSSETGTEGGQDCSFGFGSFDATLEIISVDDKTVEGRLCHVQSLISLPVPSFEGSFSAARCQ